MRAAVVLAAVVALAACEDPARRPRRRGPVAILVYGVDLAGLDAPARTDALAHTVQTLRERVRALDVPDATVVAGAGDTIQIELPGVDEAAFERARAGIARSARLAIQLAEPDAAFMRGLAHVVENDPEAARVGITAELDGWQGDGTNYVDPYLRGDRAAIERYVATRDVPADHLLGFERIAAIPPAWRTYYLQATASIGGDDVARASVIRDPQTGRAEVQLDLDDDGRAAFAALTEEARGRKLAIVLDGTVISAPVVQTRIPGGTAVITMSAGTPDEELREAERLVSDLRAGSLPAPLVELSATWVER